MKTKAILYDFDYTLADSSAAILECFQTALAGLGLPPGAPEAIRRTIGLPLEDSLVAVAGEDHRARVQEFRVHWRRRSDEIMVDWTTLLPGAATTIEALSKRRLRQAIVSTKFRIRIEGTLARDGLLSHFAAILGGEDVATHKPSPEGLEKALERLELLPGDALYVGDSLVDAEAARAAGVPFVAVLSGVTDRHALAQHRPLALLESVAQLPAWLEERDG